MYMKTTTIILMAGMLLTSCATITKGTGDDVEFTSQPEGAVATAVDIQDKVADQSCVTPCKMELNRKWTYDVTFSKDGYEPETLRLEPRLSTDGTVGMAGNVLLGGIVGAAVDGSTGAMNDLKPNPLVAILKERDTADIARQAVNTAKQEIEREVMTGKAGS